MYAKPKFLLENHSKITHHIHKTKGVKKVFERDAYLSHFGVYIYMVNHNVTISKSCMGSIWDQPNYTPKRKL